VQRRSDDVHVKCFNSRRKIERRENRRKAKGGVNGSNEKESKGDKGV
jgi:hypothetical protein